MAGLFGCNTTGPVTDSKNPSSVRRTNWRRELTSVAPSCRGGKSGRTPPRSRGTDPPRDGRVLARLVCRYPLWSHTRCGPIGQLLYATTASTPSHSRVLPGCRRGQRQESGDGSTGARPAGLRLHLPNCTYSGYAGSARTCRSRTPAGTATCLWGCSQQPWRKSKRVSQRPGNGWP